MSGFDDGVYRGFRYDVSRSPGGKAYLHVEGDRAPPRLLYPTFEAAHEGLRRWADLALMQLAPVEETAESRLVRETRERQEKEVERVFGKRIQPPPGARGRVRGGRR